MNKKKSRLHNQYNNKIGNKHYPFGLWIMFAIWPILNPAYVLKSKEVMVNVYIFYFKNNKI